MIALRCDCGASRSADEDHDAGEYEEDGMLKYICYSCWHKEVYGFPAGLPGRMARPAEAREIH